ncbi:MAG: hypothetical protein AB1938_01605 [Myxococcota bacterium]
MTAPDDEHDELDPMEEAWLDGDAEAVEAAARAALERDTADPLARCWLGLAQYLTDQVTAGQATLREGFAALRALHAAAPDEDTRDQLTSTMQAFASHLIDAAAERPTLAPGVAAFILEDLKLEHAPALRVQAEHQAGPGGDVVGATMVLKRALALDANDAETHYLLARLLARLGKRTPALKHLGRAIEHGAGLAAVRELARFEPDFDGLEDDPEFAALVDVLPDDPLLRPLYEALDRGDFAPVLALAASLADRAGQPLDVLYPWRDALELSLDSGAGDEAELVKELEKVQARIDELEDQHAVSAAYARFCGDA